MDLQLLKEADLLLSGYIVSSKQEKQMNGRNYEIQYFLNQHKNEYLITELKNGIYDGQSQLFDRGLLKMKWKWVEGRRQGDVVVYDRGKVIYTENWDSITNCNDDRRILVNARGRTDLVVMDPTSSVIVYIGNFDRQTRSRNGYGFCYDRNTGNLVCYGRYVDDELTQVIQEIEGDQMIEYDVCGGDSNLEVSTRRAVYVGDYMHDMNTNTLFRHGKGSEINSRTGCVIWEGDWEKGEKVDGCELVDGYYTRTSGDKSLLRVLDTVVESHYVVESDEDFDSIQVDATRIEITGELNKHTLSLLVFDKLEHILIGENCINSLKSLRFSYMTKLQSIVIQDNNYKTLNLLEVDNCNQLKRISIGAFAFSNNYYNNPFRIENCQSLETLTIGEGSFFAYPWDFSLCSRIWMIVLIRFPFLAKHHDRNDQG